MLNQLITFCTELRFPYREMTGNASWEASMVLEIFRLFLSPLEK